MNPSCGLCLTTAEAEKSKAEILKLQSANDKGSSTEEEVKRLQKDVGGTFISPSNPNQCHFSPLEDDDVHDVVDAFFPVGFSWMPPWKS